MSIIIQNIVQIVSTGLPWNTIKLNGNCATFGVHCYFREQFDTVRNLLDENNIQYDVDNDPWIDSEFFSLVNLVDMQSLEKNIFLI